MKKLVFAAVFFVAAGLAGAQQVQLLEDQSTQNLKKATSGDGDMPQIIMPSEENSVPAEIQEAVPADETQEEKPARPKKIFRSGLPAVSTAAVKAAAQDSAGLAVSSGPVPVAALSAVPSVPMAQSVAVQPLKQEVLRPASAGLPPGKELPTLESLSAAASKPVVLPVPKPAETVKSAAAKQKTAVTRITPPTVVPGVVDPSAAKKTPPSSAPVPAVTPVTVKAAAPGVGFSVDKMHTVAGGETLWGLSGKYYHDPHKWGKIYNANLTALSDPDRIYTDQQLVIPGITEEVKPEIKKAPAKSAGSAAGEAQLPASEPFRPAPAAAETAPVPTEAGPQPSQSSLSEDMAEFERTDLSEEMPEHQKEWTSDVKIVPDNWSGDGVVSGMGNAGDDMSGILSVDGDIVDVSLSGPYTVKAGDFLGVYIIGAGAYDKSGRRLGREVQPAGMLEVLSSDGRNVKARVANATTAIEKGYVVKAK